MNYARMYKIAEDQAGVPVSWIGKRLYSKNNEWYIGYRDSSSTCSTYINTGPAETHIGNIIKGITKYHEQGKNVQASRRAS